MIRASMPYAEYEALSGVRVSDLVKFRKSAAHYRFAVSNGSKDTPALRVGRALHQLVLEPEQFCDDGLKPAELGLVEAMAASVLSNPYCQPFLNGPGGNEFVAQWTDPITGVLCKQRCDRMTIIDDEPVLVDLKYTKGASPEAFARDIVTYAYHIKAGFYRYGLRVLGSAVERYVLIVIEKEPPYCSTYYELTPEALAQGEVEAMECLAKYAECTETATYPGYAPGYIDLPRWARRAEFYG